MEMDLFWKLMESPRFWLIIVTVMLIYAIALGILLRAMHKQKALASMYCAVLCDDEGCPQHGTPHICIDTSRLRPKGDERLTGFIPDMGLLNALVKDYDRLRADEKDRLTAMASRSVIREVTHVDLGSKPRRVLLDAKGDPLADQYEKITLTIEIGGRFIFAEGYVQDMRLLDDLIEDHRLLKEQVSALEANNTGWVVKDAQDVSYRSMTDGDVDWTPSQEHAIRFARREDAENFAHHDEDAWRIKLYDPKLQSIATPSGVAPIGT